MKDLQDRIRIIATNQDPENYCHGENPQRRVWWVSSQEDKSSYSLKHVICREDKETNRPGISMKL